MLLQAMLSNVSVDVEISEKLALKNEKNQWASEHLKLSFRFFNST